MIVIYLYVCSIYEDDEDDDDARKALKHEGLCTHLGFSAKFETRDRNRKTTQRERV